MKFGAVVRMTILFSDNSLLKSYCLKKWYKTKIKFSIVISISDYDL
jgi:hypothetical protein